MQKEESSSRFLLDGDWNSPNNHSGNKVPILSFFTGAGFLDLGFEYEGFESIWHNEYEPWFIKGFEYGIPRVLKRDIKIENNQSIVDIGPNQIFKEAFGKKSTADVFGIIGGPPCPDFSVGGKNRGSTGENGKLSRVYVNRIIELQPTFFVFENVKGLFRTGKHIEFLKILLNDLENAGYRVDLTLLNSLEFGVPQDRQRVFIVGFHKKWIKQKKMKISAGQRGWFPWPEDSRYKYAKDRFNWPKTDPFGSAISMPQDIPRELMLGTLLLDQEFLYSLPNGNDFFVPYSDKFFQVMEGDTSRKSFKRLHRWRYSPTAAYGNNEVHLHPTLPRRLSARECMLIQSAPNSYALPDTMPLSYKFKTVGNAVPVSLARAVAASVRNFMET